MSTRIIPLVDTLEDAEKFVVYASRIFRVTGTQPPAACTCLSRIFAAARVAGGLEAFLHLQIALSVDPHQTIAYEDRSALHVGRGERILLQALFSWQHNCTQDPQDALWFLSGRAIRRVAADAGRRFALEMAACELVLPERGSEGHRPWPSMQLMARGSGVLRVH